MDSGNSGSIPSSSGDEEFDSRADQSAASPPVFFNSSSLPNNIDDNSFAYHQAPGALFDIPAAAASSTYLQSRSHDQHNPNTPNPFLSPDLFGCRTYTTDSTTTVAHHHQQYGSFSPSSVRLQQKNGAVAAGKNPKKRTRISRRAPTTVMTTDTSNFRAMVQEFTGIPAQPFSIGSSYSRRLDLFSSGSAAIKPSSSPGNNSSSSPIPLHNNYPLCPTTQKFQPNLFSLISSFSSASSASASMIDGIASSTSHNTTSSPPRNYQMLSDVAGIRNSNTMMQNNLNRHPVDVSFSSLLRNSVSPLNPSFAQTENKSSQSTASQFGLPSFEDHHHHHNLAAMRHQSNNVDDQLPNHQDRQHLMMIRSFDHGNHFGNSSSSSPSPSPSQRVTNSCKLMNYSSDFHHDDHQKNLENVASRGSAEGTTVDSWICPSD